MLWLPQEDTSSVFLSPAPPVLQAGNEALAPRPVPEFHSADDGFHILYKLGSSQRFHLVLPNEASASASLVALIPLGSDGFDRIEAVARLLAALHGRRIPPDTRLTRQQLARARRMLQAIDGAHAGATQQDIAEVIFRTGKLSRDEWQASSTRHAVMGLLRGARTMIAGGYRNLLHHRRRP